MFMERLKALRIERGLTQDQLSEKLGIPASTIRRYETNKGIPDHDRIQVIADFFNVTVDYLLRRDEQPGDEETERIIKEIVREYNLDLTQPDIKKKLRDIVHLVWSDRQQK